MLKFLHLASSLPGDFCSFFLFASCSTMNKYCFFFFIYYFFNEKETIKMLSELRQGINMQNFSYYFKSPLSHIITIFLLPNFVYMIVSFFSIPSLVLTPLYFAPTLSLPFFFPVLFSFSVLFNSMLKTVS